LLLQCYWRLKLIKSVSILTGVLMTEPRSFAAQL